MASADQAGRVVWPSRRRSAKAAEVANRSEAVELLGRFAAAGVPVEINESPCSAGRSSSIRLARPEPARP